MKTNPQYNEKWVWEALFNTISYIKTAYPEIPVILDAKRGDIGTTNEAYARAVFDELKADAVTVHPYFGQEALKPFLERKDKGIILIASNSNPGQENFKISQLETLKNRFTRSLRGK